MTAQPITISPEETVAVASRTLTHYNIGMLPVCDASGALQGVLTDRDIVTRCLAGGRDPQKTAVRDIMTRQIPESFRIACDAGRYYTDSYMVEDGFASRFTCDIDKMAVGNMPNIALSAMQILLFTHPSKIYLVGCDASQGHFVQPDKLDANKIKEQEKDLKLAVSSDRVIQKWLELKAFAEVFYPDVEIISVNPVGLKGIFKDEYQEAFLTTKLRDNA
jgi:hypothetical protein